jgi:hypothetical protein
MTAGLSAPTNAADLSDLELLERLIRGMDE